MAKKSSTTQSDPASLAFSAVEDALKDSVFAGLDQPGGAADKPGAPRPAARDADNGRTERQRTADKFAAQTGSVANDDRFPNTKILYGLQSRSSQRPTLIATVAAIVWVLAIGLIAIIRNGSAIGTADFYTSNEFIGLVALAIVPVLGFFAVSTLLRRAQELRNAAAAVTQAALRLAEPETTASDKVASVGQAVRREVNALGDGLERALSRAGELEVMIHNEVTALERTYSDNESRMRALIQELASQREAVITNTERVREAITESHTGLVFDLDMISQRIAGTIVESGGDLTKALETAGNSLNSAFSERTESFVSLIDQRSGNLLVALDDSAGRLNTALEDRSGAISGAFEERTAELASVIDGRMESLTEALDSRAVTLSDAIDNRTSSLSKLLSQGGITLLDQLRDRGHEVSGALDMIGSRIASDITNRARDAEQMLSGVSRQLDESVAIQVNSMESRLQSAVIELTGALDDTTERARVTLMGAGSQNLAQFDTRLDEIAVVIDTRLQSLDGVIGEKGDRLISALEKNNANFAAQANLLELALDENSGRFNEIVGERTREMTETLGQRAKQITETISSRSREISDSLEDHSQVIAEALDGRTQLLNETLQSGSAEIERSLSGRVHEINEALQARNAELEKSLSGGVHDISMALQTRSAELETSLAGGVHEISETLQAHSAGLERSLSGGVQEINEALQSRSAEIEQSLSGGVHQLSETLQTRGNEIELSLSGRLQAIDTSLAARTQELDRTLAGGKQILDATLDEHTAALTEGLDQRTQQLALTVGTRSNELSEALNTRTQQLADTLGNRTAEIAAAITERTAELGNTIDSQSILARDRIDSSLKSVSDTMAERADAISGLVAAKVAEVNDNLGRGIDTAIIRIADAETGVTARIEEAASTVSDSARKAADIIETGVNSARRAITDMVDQRLGTLPEAITARADITAERLSALNTAINSALVQSMTDLEAGADRIEETIAQRIVVATANISDDITQTADRMDVAVRNALQQIQHTASTLDDLISVKAVTAADSIGSKVTEINRVVTEQTDTFASLVSDRAAMLENSLQNHSNVLKQALTENAQDAEELMSASTSRILTDVTAALGKLNDSNVMLQRVLDASTANLAHLETSVAEQTATYSSTVREAIGSTEEAGRLVTEHVGALQVTIAGMVQEFSSVLGSLSTEAQSIDRAAENLNSSSADALTTLDDRRGAMDALAESFTARADDIDTRMRGFAQSIADTVNDTERRLLTARKTMEDLLTSTTVDVAETLEATTGSIDHAMSRTSSQLQKVLSSTADQVHTALSTSTGQMEKALNDTTNLLEAALSTTSDKVTAKLGEFSGTAGAESERAADAMRHTQAAMILEMQRALEEATQRFNETSNAMRSTAREVGAELEATRSELARGVMELPEETRASAAAMRRVVAEQIEALAELNAIVRAQPATHDSNERPRAPERQQRDEPKPVPVVAAAAAPQPAAPQPRSAAPPSQPKAAGEGGGWLRDVLRNASATPAASEPQQRNLTSLTEEIAGAIDHNALAEAWQRYQSGEQNVFSRRIYSLTGQGTYDEVRKRLQRDVDFARTAATYMSEFEQLLQQAAAASNPAAEAHNYLLSDRGKVYTMLAHAGGRLS